MRFDFPRAFESSPFEIAFIVLFVVALVLAVIVAVTRYTAQQRSLRRHGRARGREEREEEDLVVDEQDREALERIAWLARGDDEAQELRDHPDEHPETLNRLTRRALRDGMVSFQEATQLFHHVGLEASALRGRPGSKQAVPVGARLSVADGPGNVVAGRVIDSTNDEMTIRVTASAGRLAAGEEVEAVGYSHAFLTAFESRVVARTNDSLTLQAVPRVRVAQRRRYNRVPVRVRIDVELRGASDDAFTTRTLEMSAGGASVRNRRRRLSPGDSLRCVIRLRTGPIAVRAEVRSTSRRGRIAHIDFQEMDPRTKHRILRMLFERGVRGRPPAPTGVSSL